MCLMYLVIPGPTYSAPGATPGTRQVQTPAPRGIVFVSSALLEIRKILFPFHCKELITMSRIFQRRHFFYRLNVLKGQCHKIFESWFIFFQIASPGTITMFAKYSQRYANMKSSPRCQIFCGITIPWCMVKWSNNP